MSDPRYSTFIELYPPLTKEAEIELISRAQNGDKRAREKVLNHNLSWVVTVATTQFRLGEIPLDDIVQEGSLGLLKALEKFDLKAGVRFCTYSTWWIRAFIMQFIKKRSLVKSHNRDYTQTDLSLDEQTGTAPDQTYLELVEDTGPVSDELLVSADMSAKTREALKRVEKRIGPMATQVVWERLAVDSKDSTNLETIGNRFGVSRERVRQVEKQTKKFLKEYLEKRGFGDKPVIVIPLPPPVVEVKSGPVRRRTPRRRRHRIPSRGTQVPVKKDLGGHSDAEILERLDTYMSMKSKIKKCCGSLGTRHKANCPENKEVNITVKEIPIHIPPAPVPLLEYRSDLKQATDKELLELRTMINEELARRLEEAEKVASSLRTSLGR